LHQLAISKNFWIVTPFPKSKLGSLLSLAQTDIRQRLGTTCWCQVQQIFSAQLVELPAKLNIAQILENYAKYFALNVATLPSSEKHLKTVPAVPADLPAPERKLVARLTFHASVNARGLTRSNS